MAMRTHPPPVRFVQDAFGRRIAYSVCGQGPLLVCPAWWVGHLERDWDWVEYRTFFNALAQEATVVRYDRPGSGLSDRELRGADLDDDVMVLDSVISELGAETVSLLAASCGGPPAIRWSAANPTRVEQLLLFGTYCRGGDLATPELQQALLALVRAHWGAGARALADLFSPNATPEQRQTFTQIQRYSTDAATAARLLQLTYSMDVSDDLARVRAKTTVLHRRGDRAIPFAAARALAAGIESAQLVSLPGSCHPMWMSEDAAEHVLSALSGMGSGTAEGCVLDARSRSLSRDGEQVALTPLEYGVLQTLVDSPGKVYERGELIEKVWQQPHAGSNVVDAVVRTLRKKLGRWAPSVETVVGHGYRFRRWRLTEA